MLGVFGLVGMAVLWPLAAGGARGAEGFLQRGPVWPSGQFCGGPSCRRPGRCWGGADDPAYQIADASPRQAVLRIRHPAGLAFWTWVIWGEGLELAACAGMALIVAAGLAGQCLIALGAPRVFVENSGAVGLGPDRLRASDGGTG
jgi:hypothetical protein